MSDLAPPSHPESNALVAELRELIDSARQRGAAAVNAELTLLYWRVGGRINQDILGRRAEYGEEIVSALPRHLTATHGRGWSVRHSGWCICLAQVYSDAHIVHTLCAQLNWLHLRLIAALDDPLKRDFYVELCRLEPWSVRQLQERMQSMLFKRSALESRRAKTRETKPAIIQDQQTGRIQPV
ncbi:MAG: DUF1016 N-terminal domain-containing protein [Acidobacteriota bacterium]